MRRQRTKKYLNGVRGAVIQAERRVANAKKELDAIRSFWRKEVEEYHRETRVLSCKGRGCSGENCY